MTRCLCPPAPTRDTGEQRKAEEERTTPVQVLVLRDLREVSAVLVLDVLRVLGVLLLDAVDPEGAHGDCSRITRYGQ